MCRERKISSTAAIAMAVSWTRSSGRKPDQIEGARQKPALAKAEVEHPIGVIKRVFGFAKVRYRGFRKNAHRLLVTCVLANLFIARRDLRTPHQ
jgi:IS5 family transposase